MRLSTKISWVAEVATGCSLGVFFLFWVLAIWCHPDKNATNPEASELFKEVASSYSILSDLEKRRQYDISRFEVLESLGMDMEIDLSNLGPVNTMFAALFSKLGVPFKTTISAIVLEEALNGTVPVRPLLVESAFSKSSAAVTKSSSSSSLSYRRSKSASDRNLDCARHCGAKECKGSQNLLNMMQKEAQLSVHQDSNGNSNYVPLDNRNSLENDINHLRLHLHQEKSVRVMLERAIGRASSSLSPGHRNFAVKTRELISEIELLEEEIANHEQHVLSLYINFFDQCVSGPSSGHISGMVPPSHVKSRMKKENTQA